jgi:hypothetical protein
LIAVVEKGIEAFDEKIANNGRGEFINTSL